MFETRISRATIASFGLLLLLLPLSAPAILSPDAAYCDALGYQYTVDQTPAGAVGMCELPDGQRVNAFDFVAGKVATDWSYCALNGYEARYVEESAACNNCLVCVMPDGSEVEVTRLMDLNLLETICGDGTCGIPENFQTCPIDCPSGGADGLCDGQLDGTIDPDCEEGEDPDSAQLQAGDLAVTKSDAPDPVVVGSNLTYTLMVTNNGPSEVTGVALADTLPANVDFVSASPVCGEANAIVTCNLGNLATGATTSVEIVVTPTAAGTLTNSASVSGAEADPVADNNTATEDTTVNGSDGGGNGCFIATAAYGSYLAPEVMVLRDFRDEHLLPNPIGRQLVRFYYQTSPPLADYIREREGLRMATRWALTPLIYGIKYPLVSGLAFAAVGIVLAWRRLARRRSDYCWHARKTGSENNCL